MRDEQGETSITLGTLIKRARLAKGWTQEMLIDKADLSKSTVNRWENDKGIGDPANVRKACLALGIDPREAAVVIGLVTREEWDLPPFPPPIDESLTDAARLLADEKIPDDAKVSLRDFIGGAVEFWFKQLGVRRPPREPSAADRAKGKPVARG